MPSKLSQVLGRLESATDDDLVEYFTTTTAINDLAKFNSKRVIAVGLKGIGKTATYRYFTELDKTRDIVIGIKVGTYQLNLASRNLNYETCRNQFEHDIVLEALKQVSDNRKKLTSKTRPELLDAAAKHVSTYLETLKKALGRFGGVSILGFGFTINSPHTSVAIGLRERRDIDSALQTLKEICASGVLIRIVVDDPEWVFSESRELDTHLIGGFCLAAIRLSGKIPNLKVIPLLKTHVYYPVLRDVDDLTNHPNHMERLCWTRKELVEVINRRLRFVRSSWADLFAGTEKEARELVYGMCSNIRNGPRDLLRWVDLAFQKASGNKITKAAIEQTQSQMSVDSFRELGSAHSTTCPRIDEVVKTIFRKEPHKKYSMAQLRQHAYQLWVRDRQMRPLTQLDWMQLETSQSLPELLFKTGTLALHNNGQVTLPYEENYDLDHFRSAEFVQLVPTLVAGIT